MKPIAASLLLLAPLAAQKVPLPDGSQRIVAVLDVGDLLLRPPEGEGAEVVAARLARAASSLPRIAEFVRAFAEPPLGDAVDLQALGAQFLVALGPPERVAAVEKVLAHARATKANDYYLDLRMLSVTGAVFGKELVAAVAALPGAAADAPRVAILDRDAVAKLCKAVAADPACGVVQAPQIVSPSLCHATLAVGKQIAYVRDFTVEVAEAAFVADPIVDTVWHGQRIEAICAELPDGTVGVVMEALDQHVEQPIREIKTKLPGSTQEVTVQVPRTTGCRGRQVAAVPNGATAVMAAKRNDGTWLVTLLTVSKVTPPAEPVLRR